VDGHHDPLLDGYDKISGARATKTDINRSELATARQLYETADDNG